MKTLIVIAALVAAIQVNASKLLVDSKTGALIAVFPKDIPPGFRVPPGTVLKDKPAPKGHAAVPTQPQKPVVAKTTPKPPVKKVVPADVQKARDERRAKHLAEMAARKTNSLPTRLMAPKPVKP